MQTIYSYVLPWLLVCSIVLATWYVFVHSVRSVRSRTNWYVFGTFLRPTSTRTGIPGVISYRLSGRKRGERLTRDHGFCSE